MTMPNRPVKATWMCRSLVPLLGAGAMGVVQGVSSRAINVAVEGQLVWLVASGSSRLPGGVGLDLHDGLQSIGLTAGDVVSLGPAGLDAVPGRQGTSHLARPLVSFATAVPWEAVLAPGDEAVSPSRLRRSWSLAPATGFGDQSSDPIQGWSAIGRLDRGLRAGDDVMSAVAELVGRGPGLTPSGDDVLVGCSAALRAFGHPSAGAFAAGAAAAARGRTTAVAQAYHEHAAAGRYAEHLHVLARALGDAGGDLSAAVARSLAWGATSGADTLLGVLLGAEACTVPATDLAGRWPGGVDR